MRARPPNSQPRSWLIASLCPALIICLFAVGGCGGPAPVGGGARSGVARSDAPPPSPVAAPGESPWRRTWLALDQTENACEEVFDYHPQGGMLVFYCHLLSVVGWDELLRSAPRPVFVRGPHLPGDLDLGRSQVFGHYNPVFVEWLGRALVPGADDAVFRERTQPLFDRIVRPLARTFYLTHVKLAGEPACLERELAAYRAAMAAAQEHYYERWFWFMNEAFCRGPVDEGWMMDHGFDGGFDGNVVKGTVGFWLRREIDGTRALFFAALERLLGAYDRQWLAGARGGPRHGPTLR
jgi:hypothetical protein